ncbi:unnamed protein product [Sympodiomycopsis kandeliae]
MLDEDTDGKSVSGLVARHRRRRDHSSGGEERRPQQQHCRRSQEEFDESMKRPPLPFPLAAPTAPLNGTPAGGHLVRSWWRSLSSKSASLRIPHLVILLMSVAALEEPLGRHFYTK